MMIGYSLPPQLDSEIRDLEELINKYKKGEVSATQLKAHRVPFGVYEQREPGTYMARIRCTAGMVSPEQLEKVGVIASQYGMSDIHITSRQELQIHYAKMDDIIPIIKQLKDIGLATRGGGGNTVRNIVAQEDAGIDPYEEFDVTPYASALTTILIAESDSWNLPRKFKIAFSGSAEDKGYATLADLGFIARIKNGKKGFRVYAAGGLGAKSEAAKLLFDFVDADEVYPIAKAIKNLFQKFGNRKNKHAARLRFLYQSLGAEEFKKIFNEEYAKIKQEGFLPLVIDETKNQAQVMGLALQEPCDLRDFALWKQRFVKPQKQEKLFSILIPIELGFISCERAIKLALFLKAFGDNVLRMTRDQNFLMRNIPQEHLGNAYNFLKSTFPNFNLPAIYGRILSCAGASTCQLGICLSRQAAWALMKALRESRLDLDKMGDIKLNISGCPNSCGEHPVADLGFFGKASRKGDYLYPAYNVVAAANICNGQTKLAETVAEISARDLPALVKDFLSLYLSKSTRYKTFREYVAQEGKEDLKQLCLKYQEIPVFEEDKNYYFDWDANKAFSLSERRSGECSAGLFDLIEMDLNNLKETREKLLTVSEVSEKKKQILYDLIFYSSRMLLITRGIEPKNETEAFAVFLTYFIETGLIESNFRAIIELARNKDYQALLQRESEALLLAQRVESLYENMDNSFNFKTLPLPEANKQEAQVLKVVKDLRRVACPMNFVRTKLELSKLKPGDILEIWLDEGEPIENVPGSVKAEGHRVIAQNKIGDYWSVVIEKK